MARRLGSSRRRRDRGGPDRQGADDGVAEVPDDARRPSLTATRSSRSRASARRSDRSTARRVRAADAGRVVGNVAGQPFEQVVPIKARPGPTRRICRGSGRSWRSTGCRPAIRRRTAIAIVSSRESMFVMSPFTSLLVLENDDMQKQYRVEGGRKDHWAKYTCSGADRSRRRAAAGPAGSAHVRRQEVAAGGCEDGAVSVERAAGDSDRHEQQRDRDWDRDGEPAEASGR